MARTLDWHPLVPFGAEVHVDLSAPLDGENEEQLVQLLWTHGLIVARGQHISEDQQRRLCASFGPILSRTGERGYLTNEGGGTAASEYAYHSDGAYTEDPLDCIALFASDVVDEASSTRFVNVQDGLTTLPESLRAQLEGFEQEMISPLFTELARRTCDKRDPEAHVRATRPTFYINPHNGRRCVWVSEMQTAALIGMKWEDSRDLLNEVYDHVYAPAGVLEHRWRNGDLVIWDNIALQHARGNLESVGKRILQRVVVGVSGTVPNLAA